ncbi:hypothetical protein GGI19_005855 [Coemansia pectinata]|uniref:Sulfatase N-terminal domain-containing protein n=1 Tax=Coemansia pectinata TaxID=1052879 RepID=A0A9W8GSY0_9FUNG|nr:hypothetical protein GGI19_005855 [Coemansia pectinata]
MKLVLVSLVGLLLSGQSFGAPNKCVSPQPPPVTYKKPNFVVILTDDQDQLMNSLDYQPYVKRHFIDEGTSFTKYYTTSAMCCPSRVSLWLGQFAHNHNVTDESRPHGSYYKFQAGHLDDSWLPVWLQEEGYSNHYIGKFINGVNKDNTVAPKGWDHFEPLVSPGIYNFTNPIFSLNGGPLESFPGVYQTDLILNKSLARIDALVEKKKESDNPFLLVISPTAPHDEIQGDGTFTPPVPADRHKHLFPNAKVPRTPNFNPAVQDKVGWIGELPLLSPLQVEEIDHHYRQRLRSLQATDELVDSVVKKLAANDLLDNTYLIYTTDNGYHLGQHRLFAGKQTPIENDINIPFIIRGPGIAKKQIKTNPATHSHFPATVLDLAGIKRPTNLDATSLFDPEHTESFNVEFWSNQFTEGGSKLKNKKNSYKALRLISQKHDLYYSVWCTHEHEFYDMKVDPYQLTNKYPAADRKLLDRLDALVAVLHDCKGEVCKFPWRTIHKDGLVHSLDDALDAKHDAFYSTLPKFRFKSCKVYYDADNEGTQ